MCIPINEVTWKKAAIPPLIQRAAWISWGVGALIFGNNEIIIYCWIFITETSKSKILVFIVKREKEQYVLY